MTGLLDCKTWWMVSCSLSRPRGERVEPSSTTGISCGHSWSMPKTGAGPITLRGGCVDRLKKHLDLGIGEGWGAINIIPSDLKGPCRDVLVAFCFDGDSFNDRLREVAYHAGIHCPEKKLIVLVTSRWNPREWKKNHEEAFANLIAKLAVFFVGFGKLSRIG